MMNGKLYYNGDQVDKNHTINNGESELYDADHYLKSTFHMLSEIEFAASIHNRPSVFEIV
jgi:hypothetical protein